MTEFSAPCIKISQNPVAPKGQLCRKAGSVQTTLASKRHHHISTSRLQPRGREFLIPRGLGSLVTTGARGQAGLEDSFFLPWEVTGPSESGARLQPTSSGKPS